MAVRIQCPVPTCGAVCSAKDAALGQSVKCPKCGGPFVATRTLDGKQSEDTRKSRPTATEEAFPVLPASFGRYRVLKLLGRGGMGAVYLAEDSQLGRKVALKIPFIAGSDAVRVERFAREARSAAGLQHPNICNVFDAGTIEGRPFLTMTYVAGQPLDHLIDTDAQLPARRAAEIVRGIARALAYAHDNGVTHRDLKPANVMLTAAGEPVVMDFGLAKVAGEADAAEVKLTRQGGLVGTPSYMSPEQVRGDIAAIGPASDVYSLGVVLFELLAGRPPYTGSMAAVLGQILGAPVPPVAGYRKDVPVWLEAICQQAMAKEIAARFPGMVEFARSLDAYLEPTGSTHPPAAPRPKTPVRPVTGSREVTVEVELVRAPTQPKPGAPKDESLEKAALPSVAESPFEQLSAPAPVEVAPKSSGRPIWRRPVLVAAGLLLPLVAWAAAVVFRVETPNGTIVVEINDPVVEARIKEGRLILTGPDGKDRYILTAAERDKKIDAGPYKIRVEGADGLSLDTPEFTLTKGDRVTVRVKLEPKAVGKVEAPPVATGIPPGSTVPAPAKELVALRRESLPAAVLAYAGGGYPERAPASLVGALGEAGPIQTDAVLSLAYSPDGRWLASASRDKSIHLRDAASGQVKRVLAGHIGPVQAVAFAKDGKSLVSAGLDGTVRWWDVDKDGPPKTLAQELGEVLSMASSVDGRFLAVGRADRPILLWRWGQWASPSDLEPVKGPVTSLTFSGSGETLAASWDGVVRLYRTADGRATQTWPGDSSNRFLTFNNGNKWLAATGGLFQTWDVETGQLVGKRGGGAGPANALAVHPEGKVAYASENGGVATFPWTFPGMEPYPEETWPRFFSPLGLTSMVFRPDGKHLAFGTASGGVQVWDFSAGKKVLPKWGHTHHIVTVSAHPNGQAVLTGGDDNAVLEWGLARPHESRLIDALRLSLNDVVYSPNGKSFST
ncbi:MAG TPA: protein kinase, partial [Urbifossiella sp.]|nr:protein kinase [Urbifossiella sp.]